METAARNEADLAVYYRKRGFYPEQIAGRVRTGKRLGPREHGASGSGDHGREKTGQGSGERIGSQGPRIGRNRSAVGFVKKGLGDLEGLRSRMISTPHHQTAVVLINDAITAGARRAEACFELEISDGTLRRWTKNGQVQPDLRPLVPRPKPTNKLSAAERAAVLEVCNSTKFASLPPCQIVPKLAD